MFCNGFFFFFPKEFTSEGRPNAKRVLVVITDKRSTSKLKNVTNEAKELEMEDIRVIPVAMGGEADLNELQKITPWLDDIIQTEKDDNPYKVAVKILSTALEGRLRHNYYTCFKQTNNK